jgi:hypothetical protein
MAGPERAQRLVAVDFFRGACLLMIFIDHIPGNPVSMLTLRSWGFADAAEVFVFLAGFSATLAFDRYFRFSGFLSGCLRIAKRAWQLFRAHVLLVFALSTVIATAGNFTDSKPIMEQMNFSPFFVETEVAILRIVKLQYMPNLTDVLPIYIVFIGMFPVIWLVLELSPFAALAVSGLLWAFANITGHSLPNYPEGVKWFFNPLAWQFMFVSGAVLSRLRGRTAEVLGSRLLFWLALIVVILSALAAAPWTNLEAFSEARIVPSSYLPVNDKTNLSLARIVHFAALLFLAGRVVRASLELWKSRSTVILAVVGRHALPIYCVGVVMALTVQIFTGIRNSGPAEVIATTLAGVALLIGIALTLEWAVKRLRVIPVSGGGPITIRASCPNYCSGESFLDLRILRLGSASRSRYSSTVPPSQTEPTDVQRTLAGTHHGDPEWVSEFCNSEGRDRP